MTSLPEDEAVAALQEAVKESLRRIREAAADAIRSKTLDEADAAFMARLSVRLGRMIDEEADTVMSGKFGQILLDAAETAGEDMATAGVLGTISYESVAIAMYNSEVHVKDLLDESTKTVNRLVTNALVTGKSTEELADMLYDELTIGEGMDITLARAETIARNELFSIYRQTSKMLADENGVTKFKMIGPDDDRISPICEEHVGQVKTQEEWEDIEPMAFVYGLHVNCRHTFEPVPVGSSEEGD